MLTVLLSSAVSLSLAAPPAWDDPAAIAWQGLVKHYAGADAIDLDARFQMFGDDNPYHCQMRFAKGLNGTAVMARGEERIEFVGNGKGFYVLNAEQETYLKIPGGFAEAPLVGYLGVFKTWAGARAQEPTRLSWIEQTPPNPLISVIKAEFPDRTETLWIGPDHALMAVTLHMNMGDVKMGGHVTFSRAAALRGVDPKDFRGVLPPSYSELRTSTDLLLPVGLEVPEIALTSLEGREFQLDDLRGKTVLLNFWFYT